MRAADCNALVGSWSCAGRFARVDRTISSRMRVSRAADGEALLIEARDDPPNRFAYSALWSWDAKAGSPVLVLAGNLGAGAPLPLHGLDRGPVNPLALFIGIGWPEVKAGQSGRRISGLDLSRIDAGAAVPWIGLPGLDPACLSARFVDMAR